jgi:hypothetical protein
MPASNPTRSKDAVDEERSYRHSDRLSNNSIIKKKRAKKKEIADLCQTQFETGMHTSGHLPFEKRMPDALLIGGCYFYAVRPPSWVQSSDSRTALSFPRKRGLCRVDHHQDEVESFQPPR